MLNDCAGAKRKSRLRCFLLGRILRRSDGSSLLRGSDRSVLLRGDDRSGLLCGNDRSSLPAVSFAGARVLRAIGPVPNGRPLNDLTAAVRIARRLRAQLPLHLHRLIRRAPNNNNRSALPAVHLARMRALRAIRPTGRLHRKPLLATEALTPADGGSRSIGRGSRAEQTNNQNDETEYSHGPLTTQRQSTMSSRDPEPAVAANDLMGDGRTSLRDGANHQDWWR
jgi:hypothetical protein